MNIKQSWDERGRTQIEEVVCVIFVCLIMYCMLKVEADCVICVCFVCLPLLIATAPARLAVTQLQRSRGDAGATPGGGWGVANHHPQNFLQF